MTGRPALPRRLPGPSFNGLKRGLPVLKLTYKVSADAESAEIVLVKMAKVAHDPSSLMANLMHCSGVTGLQVMADAPRMSEESPLTSPVAGTSRVATLPGSSVSSTTEAAHSCQSHDQYASLQRWSAERRSWCCWHHHVGCSATPTQSPKLTPATADAAGEEPGVRDCHALEPSDWSDRKLQWCCKYFKWDCDHPSLFDCDAGLASWQMGWSAVKKVWCCEHRQKGCEVMTTTMEQYNCTVGHLHLDTGWSSEKKSWCCWHHDVGCVAKPAQPAVSTRGVPSSTALVMSSMPAPTSVSTTTQSSTGTATTTGPTPTTAAASTPETAMVSGAAPSTRAKADVPDGGAAGQHTFNCVFDLAHWQTAWDEPKRRWCCDHFHWGCHGSSSSSAVTTTKVSSSTYDCWAGVSNYKIAWSAAKRHWCCLKEHLACDSASTGTAVAHNCSEGRETCITGWSLAKKSWCLQVAGQGCLLTPAPLQVLPAQPTAPSLMSKARVYGRGGVITQPSSVGSLALLLALIALAGILAVWRLRWVTQPSPGKRAEYVRCDAMQGILCTDAESVSNPRREELAGNSREGSRGGPE